MLPPGLSELCNAWHRFQNTAHERLNSLVATLNNFKFPRREQITPFLWSAAKKSSGFQFIFQSRATFGNAIFSQLANVTKQSWRFLKKRWKQLFEQVPRGNLAQQKKMQSYLEFPRSFVQHGTTGHWADLEDIFHNSCCKNTVAKYAKHEKPISFTLYRQKHVHVIHPF